MLKNKQLLVTAAILVCLAALIGLQVHNSQKFEWHTFWSKTRDINWWMILLGIVVIHGNYFLRAFRWAIFLRPVKGRISTWELIPSQIVGFAGLALLGRPGELIRPYLVAKREQLTFSSQLAVWTVERIFDLGSIGVILAVNVLASSQLKVLPIYPKLRLAALLLLGGVSVAAFFAYMLRRSGKRIASLCEKLLSRISPHLSQQVGTKIEAFGDGLHTVHDFGSFLALTVSSLLIWISIGLTYLVIVRAYPDLIQSMSFSETVSLSVLLLGCSVAGSIVALPAVGGGSQLATITAMVYFFRAHHFTFQIEELATSCGIMLWLTTFASVVPTGLAVARAEHVSLRRLSRESETTAEQPARAEVS